MIIGGQTLVHNFLETSALIWPDKTAFVHDEVRATYDQINAMANRLAFWLRKQGLANGDRVLIFMENSIGYVISYYGTLKSGAIAVPLSCDSKLDSLVTFLEEIQPMVVITSGKFEQLLQNINLATFNIKKILIESPSRPWQSLKNDVVTLDDVVCCGNISNPVVPIDDSALASIIYTSGSTGRPKGVMLSHKNIVSNTFSIVTYLKLRETDISMVVLPFFYVMGKSLLNTHFAVGGTVVVNNRFAFPACVIEQMVSEGITGFSGVPSTYAHLLYRSPLAAYRDRLVSLRYCSQAGGHMSSVTKEKLLQALPAHTKLYIMYGATEAAARLTYVEPEHLRKKLDSIGTPIPGVTVKILDEMGNEVPYGREGELVACGPNIMRGYWRDEESSLQVLDKHGYHTGDLGYQDEDGYLFVTGRKDNLLKVCGHRINPQEIEDALMKTGLLMEVAVIGIEDKLQGKRLREHSLVLKRI
jgi:long-chain acyl-CoA synthetase